MSRNESLLLPRSPLGWLLLGCVLLVLAGGAGTIAAAVESFEELSRRLEATPADMLAGNTLRRVCREEKSVERCIVLFDRLADSYPGVQAVRINAALAYVDELPNHSLYMQARISTHSMDHVSAILKADPDNWLALYIRGLNNLYWPLWYRRTDRAIADLTHCIQVSEKLLPAQRKLYMALGYVALGDTYARLDRIDDALAVWKRGSALYASKQLQDRIRTDPHRLHELIEGIRSRDVPIDTDLRTFIADAGVGGP